VSYYANNSERAQLIKGLHELAEFLKNNEDVPAPSYTDVLVFPHEVNDETRRREIDRIAALIGVVPENAGHYVASRRFGPIEYRAVAIPDSTKEAAQ
jgi:hypothetical protein